MARAKAWRRIGSHRGYDGDAPWWTVRFAAAPRRDAVAALAEQVPDLALSWDDDRQAVLDPGDPAFDDDRAWKRFYAAVDALLDDLHASYPLLVVVFAGHDDMHLADDVLVERYLALDRARGDKRNQLILAALDGDSEALQRVALSHAGALLGTAAQPQLFAWAEGNEDRRQRIEQRVVDTLRTWAFDYGERPEALSRALLALPLAYVDRIVPVVGMAAARNAPELGRVVALGLQQAPAPFERLVRLLQQRDDDVSHIALAFVEHERGDDAAALRHVEAARALLREKVAKTPLWRETIPGWLDALAARLAPG
ncbi:MAG: hypothetical protein R3F59_11740 [Myxococcota bacterium]